MRAWIFSHTRGTPKNTVGRTSRRLSGRASRLSAKYVQPPTAVGMKSETHCSAMCESGRYEMKRSLSSRWK
jgi:hypothetical protein